MAVCVVTGGAGFIGSHLVDALAGAGHGVRVLDNLSTGSLANLAAAPGRVEFVQGDVADLGAVRAVLRGAHRVFHHAALASVPLSIADPMATQEVCANGTLNVLIAAQEAGVRRVVYAASSSAYGNSGRVISRESDAPQPLSPYAVAKLTGEYYCKAFHHVHGLETVCLRYFNVFGPRQPPDSPYSAVIPLFIDALLDGRSPVVHGDGQQSRDFTYVANVVRANMLAAESPAAPGETYNVACGRSTTLLDLLELLNELLCTSVRPDPAPARQGDIRRSQADISCARADLGFEPVVDLVEGLRRSLPYYKALRQDRGTPNCAQLATA